MPIVKALLYSFAFDFPSHILFLSRHCCSLIFAARYRQIVEVEGGDEAALERLLFPERFSSRNLADLIADKIREKVSSHMQMSYRASQTHVCV